MVLIFHWFWSEIKAPKTMKKKKKTSSKLVWKAVHACVRHRKNSYLDDFILTMNAKTLFYIFEKMTNRHLRILNIFFVFQCRSKQAIVSNNSVTVSKTSIIGVGDMMWHLIIYHIFFDQKQCQTFNILFWNNQLWTRLLGHQTGNDFQSYYMFKLFYINKT